MFNSHSLDILLLVNFSDACFGSIPAIVQIAETLKVRLTMLHVYNPARTRRSDAEAQLDSFFPEAHRYAPCHRIVVPGSLIEAVRRHLKVWPVNLIAAPAADTRGIPRIGHRSTRSRLVKECGVPVWTVGRRVELQRLTQPVRNVACWLDYYSWQTGHLAFSMEYANKLNAKLHLLRALPEIHEGSLILGALRKGALHPGGASKEILALCANAPNRPGVHVSSGEGRPALVRMLRECDADVVFLPGEESSLAEWLGFGLRLGDGIPCSAIYVGDHLSAPVWNLETGAANRAVGALRDGARLRGQLGVAGVRKGVGVAAISWLAS